MESVLIIGLGEIGRPLYEIIVESGRFRVYGLDIDIEKMRDFNTVGDFVNHVEELIA